MSAEGGADRPVLAGRYALVARIAVGGMGEVWRADDLLLGRVVAVKTLKPEFADDEDFRARFRAEARHAARLGHPGIASVYDFGEGDGRAWLVMELVEGEPLSTLLRREQVLSVDRTLDLVAQTADALQAAHDGGVVHRDVKPGNLLVRPDGVLKVTDFGIASASDSVPLTGTGLVVGTAYYLSPEQAAGRSGSPASDVYSLGVVAYECLAGARPFPGDNPVSVALAHLRDAPPPLPASVPAPVRALVERALAKDPADRFASARDLAAQAAALRAAVEDGAWAQAPEDGGLAALPVRPPASVLDAPGPEAAPEQLAPTGLLPVASGGSRRVPGPPRRTPGSRARSSRAAVSAAAALLLVLAAGLGLRAAFSAPSPVQAASGSDASTAATARPSAAAASARPSAAAARPTPPAVARVAVDAARYVGRPAAEVRAELTRLGLVPRLAYDGQGQPVGTVSGVQPAGSLAVGSDVLVHVVPAPPAAPQPDSPAAEPVAEPDRGKGPSKGKGRDKK